MPGKIIWLDNCPPYVCWKDVYSMVKIQYTEIKKKRLKGWEPEFKGTGGEAYTTSNPSPYLSLGLTHIYRNEITITLPALLTTLSCRSVWQSRRGDKIDRLISLFGQHPLKLPFPAWFPYNGILTFWFACTIFLSLFTISEISLASPSPVNAACPPPPRPPSWGYSHMKGAGMLVGNFDLNP